MQRFLAIAILAVLPTAHADERMAEVAAYVNAVWFAEEFNDHCPKSPIEVPVTETELRRLLVLSDGGNFVDEVARDPNIPDMNFRDDMKDMARASTVDGCDSETAFMLRARVEKELAVPDLIVELLQNSANSQ